MSDFLNLSIIGLALVLGLKHSFDADHIVAVSTYLTRSNKLRSALRLSIYWAIGHMLTAAVITFILFTFKDVFLSQYLSSFEFFVGIMLIVLGVIAFRDIKKIHVHAHKHGKTKHEHFHLSGTDHHHKHMFGIGIFHGLASNDELLILIVAEIGMTTFFGMLVGLLFFTIGVIAGMMIFSFIVTYPILKWGGRIRVALVAVSGAISIVYGALMLAGF